jgi:hypothetical protein
MSALADAITQGMVANMNPMNAVVNDYASVQTKQATLTLTRDKRSLIKELNQDISDLGDNPDPSSLATIRAMIEDVRKL